MKKLVKKLMAFFRKPEENDGIIWLLETPYRNY